VEFKDNKDAKLSFAGVAGFDGGFIIRLRFMLLPEGWAERGVERADSCWVGFWRKGEGAGGFGEVLRGAAQSRPARSSIVKA